MVEVKGEMQGSAAASIEAATTAEASTSFHASFAPVLTHLQESVASAATTQEVDEILPALIAAKDTLRDRKIEGKLTRWDEEQYEKKLAALQSQLAGKQSSLRSQSSQASPLASSSSSSTSKFSFRRPAAKAPTSSAPANTGAQGQADKSIAMSPDSEPAQAPVPPPKSSSSSSSNVQIALQTQRLISFKDLSKALESASEDAGLSLSLSHLSECIVDFRSIPRSLVAISATNVKGSLLLLPGVTGSIMMDGLEDSIVVAQSCRQFRMHSSRRASLLVNTSSPLTIESCRDVKAAPLSGNLVVQDFDEPGAGPSDRPTKSWQPLSPAERASLDTTIVTLSESGANEGESLEKLQTTLASLSAPPASPYRAEDSGVLLVFSDPGQTSTLDEFHDWYDHEHVPMRTEGYEEFRSAARYSVPVSWHLEHKSLPVFEAGWAALYVISSNALYENPAYVALRSQRSPREADLVARLGILDRRIYKTVADSAGIEAVRQADVEAKARRVEYLGFSLPPDVSEDAVKAWFVQQLLPRASKELAGLERLKVVRLLDALVNGTNAAESNADAKHIPEWALVAEFSTDAPSQPEDGDATQNSSLASFGWPSPQAVVVERRVMRLYKAWEPTRALAGRGLT
ncbi:unnamed protein product [Parajaminaea phylloscopi]